MPIVEDPDNLTIVCKKHKQKMQFEHFGRNKMQIYRCKTCGLTAFKSNLQQNRKLSYRIVEDVFFEKFMEKLQEKIVGK